MPPTASEEVILSSSFNGTRVEVVRGVLTSFVIDAVVSAANSGLRDGGGLSGGGLIDGQIHRAAGGGLLAELKRRYPDGGEIGKAYHTYNHFMTFCKGIIHAIGPRYNEATKNQNTKELYDVYSNSLQTTRDHRLRSIAFPTISTGDLRFPADDAARIAMQSVKDWLGSHVLGLSGIDRVVFLMSGGYGRDEMIYTTAFP
jgi:O-acetyl-ADP-ribose deacetylase (regulator of RNase III)